MPYAKATADAWGDLAGAYNFSDIVARLNALPRSPEPPEPPSAEPPRFSLNNIHLDDGALILDDRPTGDHHEVTSLAVGVPFVSTLPVYPRLVRPEPGLRVVIDGTPFADRAAAASRSRIRWRRCWSCGCRRWT